MACYAASTDSGYDPARIGPGGAFEQHHTGGLDAIRVTNARRTAPFLQLEASLIRQLGGVPAEPVS
jgi:hypothetical protein